MITWSDFLKQNPSNDESKKVYGHLAFVSREGEIIKLVEALKYYANRENYCCNNYGLANIDGDLGNVAQKCLKDLNIGE